MNKSLFFLLAGLVVAALVTGGCKKKDEYKPQALEKITQQGVFTTVWRAKLPESKNAYGYKLAPVYADGAVFVAAKNGLVQKRDSDTGKVLWSVNVGQELSAGPGVGDHRVVVGSPEGQVWLLDADTGAEQWTARLSSEILAPPAIAGGVVIVRLHDGHVHAFDVDTGKRRWMFDTIIPNLTLRGNSTPLVRAGRVYIGFDNGKVAAVRLTDGSVVWMRTVVENQGKTELERIVDIDGDMALVATELYLSSAGGKTLAVATESGNVLWSRDIGSATGVAVSRTQLYLTDMESVVHAVNRHNGVSLWQRDGFANRQLTRPSHLDGHVLMGDLEGWVHVLDAETGTPKARKQFGKSAFFAPPLVIGDMVYVYNQDGSLTAFRYDPDRR